MDEEKKPMIQRAAEGWRRVGDRLGRLIDVKSIVTLSLCGVFCYLAATGQVTVEQFLTVFTVVIAFYFGTQAKKADKGE